MTKRDVVVWFCKIVGLVGIIGALSALANTGLVGLLVPGISLGGFGGNILPPIFSLACYLFIWIFAVGIGELLLIPGEKDDLFSAKSGLPSLFLRCAGLWLLLSTAITFSPTLLFYAYQKLAAPTVSTPTWSTASNGFMLANLLTQFGGIVLGFLLGFAPRFRAFLRPITRARREI